MKRLEAMAPDEVRRGNREWWHCNTMSYDWKDVVGLSAFPRATTRRSNSRASSGPSSATCRATGSGRTRMPCDRPGFSGGWLFSCFQRD